MNLLGIKILLTQYSSGSTALLTLFRLSMLLMNYLSRFIPSFRWYIIDSSLTHVINPTSQSNRFSFFSKYLGTTCFIRYWFWNYFSKSYWELGLTPLKERTIARYAVSDLPLFCYLPPNNYWGSIDTTIFTWVDYNIIIIKMLLCTIWNIW